MNPIHNLRRIVGIACFFSLLCLASFAQTTKPDSSIRIRVRDGKFLFNGNVGNQETKSEIIKLVESALPSGQYTLVIEVDPNVRLFFPHWQSEFEAELKSLRSWKSGLYFFSNDEQRVKKAFHSFLQSSSFSPNRSSTNIPLLQRESKADLICLWATWTGPFLAQLPTLDRLYQQYSSRGLNIIALNVDDEEAKRVDEYRNYRNIRFKTAWADDVFTKTFMEFTRFQAIPQCVILANGRVENIYLGGAPKVTAKLESDVESIFSKR